MRWAGSAGLGLLGALLLAACFGLSQAAAQNAPPDGRRNPACVRLEAQLASLDRDGGDGRAEQVRRYEEAARRQQAELERIEARASQLGCGRGGFFLFGGSPPPQCNQINIDMQRMRSNLDRMLSGLQQLRAGSGSSEEQRRALYGALGQNDCGPQYRAAAQARGRGLFESLFGQPSESPDIAEPVAPPPPSSSFKTVCVRTCDGYYFPISNVASQSRFADDERKCKQLCPATDAQLFIYRNPGEDMSKAMSTAGKPYSELPNAFRYRREVTPSCGCKQPGESWAEALAPIEDRVQNGDIVVTEEGAKTLAQPEQPKAERRPAASRTSSRKPATAPAAPAGISSAPLAPATSALPPPPSPPPEPTIGAATERPRAVGPQFYR